jgi:uncharacterized protein (TIGR00251 family)
MIIKVKVKPNAGKEEIVQISEGEYEISVKERAEKGKANLRVIWLLSRKFGVDAKNIKIKNPKSRRKIVEVKG